MGIPAYAVGAAAVVVTIIILLLVISVLRLRAKAARVEAIMQEHRAKMAEEFVNTKLRTENNLKILEAAHEAETRKAEADVASGDRGGLSRDW